MKARYYRLAWMLILGCLLCGCQKEDNTTATAITDQADLVTVYVPAKTETTQKFQGVSENEYSYSYEYSYDDTGHVLSTECFDDGNLYSLEKYTYDSEGNLSSHQSFDSNNTLLQEKTCSYANGLLASEYTKYLNTDTSALVNYNYADNGALIDATVVDSEGVESSLFFTYNSNGFPDICQVNQSNGCTLYIALCFDNDFQLCTSNLSDSRNISVIYSYDGEEMTSCSILDGAEEDTRIEYSYYPEESKKVSTMYNGTSVQTDTVFYDNNGNIVLREVIANYAELEQRITTITSTSYIALSLNADDATRPTDSVGVINDSLRKNILLFTYLASDFTS